jgi:hypothetical protein
MLSKQSVDSYVGNLDPEIFFEGKSMLDLNYLLIILLTKFMSLQFALPVATALF